MRTAWTAVSHGRSKYIREEDLEMEGNGSVLDLVFEVSWNMKEERFNF